MTKRSLGLVLVWSVITCGFYCLIWFSRTKNDLNARGAAISSSWLMIVPGANLYWMWQFAAALAKLTAENPRNRQVPALLAFAIQLFAWMLAPTIFQDAINVVIRNEQDVLPAARVV